MTVEILRPGWVSLHNHTSHSVLDGAARIKALAGAAFRNGLADGDDSPAVGISDHGTLSGCRKFIEACLDKGVKPIIGCEFYLSIGSRFDRDSIIVGINDIDLDSSASGDATGKTKHKRYQHITVFAYNRTGWENLVRLNNAANREAATWYKPRIDLDLLCSLQDGLICLTGCLGGPVAGPILQGDMKTAERNLAQLVGAFGRDRVFVEVMDHSIAAEKKVIGGLVELAKKFGLEVVATNDAHYVEAENADGHEAWLCHSTKSQISDDRRFKFQGEGYHLRTPAEMRALFNNQPGTELAVVNSLKIAEMVTDDDVIGVREKRIRLPKFDPPADWTPSAMAKAKGLEGSSAYLWDQIIAGAWWRYGASGKIDKVVQDRISFEFGIIDTKGLGDYFLIVQDMIEWARSVGIRVGPGRGSAAGCAISYCLGIVNVEPISNGLLFERFLSIDRMEMPDIDIDFETGRRNEVFVYLAQRWGYDRVARIGNLGTLKSKGALKAAASVLDETDIGDELSRSIPMLPGGKPLPLHMATDESASEKIKTLASDFLSRKDKNVAYQAVVSLALEFEDLIDKEGIHACGIVVSDVSMEGDLPRRYTATSDVPVLQNDAVDISAADYMKIDALSLRNLDVVASCVNVIKETTGEDIDPDFLPTDLDDPNLTEVDRQRIRKTWKLLGEGKTSGVFQLESQGMTALTVDMRPTSLNDLSALLALYRPGPLGANMHTRYVERKHGREAVDYGMYTRTSQNAEVENEIIESVFADTYGVCVTGDTRIYSVTRGHLINIDEAEVGEVVQGVDEDNNLASGQITHFMDNGDRQVMKLSFSNGQTLRATPDHKVLTNRGWIAAGDLVSGDLVAEPSRYLNPDVEHQRDNLVSIVNARGIGVTLAEDSWFVDEAIPQEFMSADDEIVRALVSQIIASGRPLFTVSPTIVEQIQFLALRLGIQSQVRPMPNNENAFLISFLDSASEPGGIRWIEVPEIATGGIERVYDITVAGIHNFIANGVVVHNCVYQEQMMSIAAKVGGFDPVGTNKLRKAVSKKNADELAKVGTQFVEGAQQEIRDEDGNLVKPAFHYETAERLWDTMKSAGEYSFNKAHSFSYGTLSYMTAYLKANWPEAYAAGLLMSTKDNERRLSMLTAMREEGVAVVLPSVNGSLVKTSVNASNEVSFGLSEIKGANASEMHRLVAERDRGGLFTSFDDLCSRCFDPGLPPEMRVGRGEIPKLIESGAMDEFAPKLPDGTPARKSLMFLLATAGIVAYAEDDVPLMSWSYVEQARRERKLLGVLLSASPLTHHTDELKSVGLSGIKPQPISRVVAETTKQTVVTVGVLASWAEKSGHWGRRASYILEGSSTYIRGVAWSRTMDRLTAQGNIPSVGDVVIVRGLRKVRQAPPPPDALDDDDSSGVEHVEPADERPELTLDDLEVLSLKDTSFRDSFEVPEFIFDRPDDDPRMGQMSIFDGPPSAPTEPTEPQEPEPEDDPVPAPEDEPIALGPETEDVDAIFDQIVSNFEVGGGGTKPDDGGSVATMEAPSLTGTVRPPDRSGMVGRWTVSEFIEMSEAVYEFPWSPGQVDEIIVEASVTGTDDWLDGARNVLCRTRPEIETPLDNIDHLTGSRFDRLNDESMMSETKALVYDGVPIMRESTRSDIHRRTWIVRADEVPGAAALNFAATLRRS